MQVPLLFSCCIPVKGAKRSTVCDLQREAFVFIPNILYEVFAKYRGKSLQEISSAFPLDFEMINNYFDLLYKGEYLFYTDQPELFPEINIKEWDEPSKITNAIIDIDENSFHDFNKIVRQLNELGCRNYQIRCFSEKGLLYYDNILALLHNIHLYSLQLIIKYSNYMTEEYLDEICERNKFIFALIIHSSPKNEQFVNKAKSGYIQFTSDPIMSESHCGVINPDYFSLNIKSFSESISFNSCLNRKISIDKKGYIKNCPSMPTNFGNIEKVDLNAVLDNPDYKGLWNISKDQISVCKECEFRYICTDCRAYTKDDSDRFSKPLKCDYNPFTTEGFNNVFKSEVF